MVTVEKVVGMYAEARGAFRQELPELGSESGLGQYLQQIEEDTFPMLSKLPAHGASPTEEQVAESAAILAYNTKLSNLAQGIHDSLGKEAPRLSLTEVAELLKQR